MVSALGEPAELWENVSPAPQHWIELRLTGTKSNRDGIGARIRIGNQFGEVTSDGRLRLFRERSRLHFGLGAAAGRAEIEIRWPDGRCADAHGGKADQV